MDHITINDSARECIDNPDYRYFVLVLEQTGYRLESGWEHQEDADDAARECRENGTSCKVITRVGLRRRGIV